MTLLQDIHYTDNNFWTDLLNCWNTKNYVRAVRLLEENQELTSKYVNAAWFNVLTNNIYSLETQSDPSFKNDKIQVGYDLPTDISIGSVFFELAMSTIKVYQSYIGVGNTSTEIAFNGVFLNAYAFQNGDLVQVDINYADNLITFSIENVTNFPVLCRVVVTNYSIENIFTNVQVLDSNNLRSTVTIPSSQQLVSIYCTKNNNLVQVDINYSNNQITFEIGSDSVSAGEQVKCYYITASLEDFPFTINSDNINVGGTSVSLSYDGTIISFLNYINSYMILTDCALQNNQVTISLSEPATEQINCSIIY